jgi:acetyltransferase-like isoleucine patch superfamily enzyme
MNKIKSLIYYATTYWYYKLIFGAIGKRSRLFEILKLDNPQNIYIGSNVKIYKFTWLAASPLTGAGKCRLVIGDGTNIGNFNHIYATSSIYIGKNVLTADKVYISDNLHSYENVELPVIRQPIKQINDVIIGDGAWLGENVCVVGCSIGKGSVIGANSVVTKDIPDFCVAVGAPAKVIKKYNAITQCWEKVNQE